MFLQVKNLSVSVDGKPILDDLSLTAETGEVAAITGPDLGCAPLVKNVGVFGDETAALSGVVDTLVSSLDPGQIWLFGSRARGEARPDSDFDLLVVAKPRGNFGSLDYVRARSPLRDLGVACDVVPCSAEDFEEELKHSHSFVGQIVERGKRVYESPTR